MFKLPNIFRRKKRFPIVGSQDWQCPNCGAVLSKTEEGEIKAKLFSDIKKKGATVTNLARCMECGATVDGQDVYAGMFDTDKQSQS